MQEYPNNRGGAADPFEAIERLTPSPAAAIEGMRAAYLSAFRDIAGIGSARLSLLAWATWSACLRDGSGIRTAARRAEEAACDTRRLHVSKLARVWVSAEQVRAAARYASRTAAASR